MWQRLPPYVYLRASVRRDPREPTFDRFFRTLFDIYQGAERRRSVSPAVQRVARPGYLFGGVQKRPPDADSHRLAPATPLVT